MSDAPERIWAWPNMRENDLLSGMWRNWDAPIASDAVTYIRADHVDALVVAADALAAWAKAILDRKPSLVTGGRLVLERDLVGLDTTDLVCLDAALAAYNEAKEDGA